MTNLFKKADVLTNMHFGLKSNSQNEWGGGHYDE